MQDFASLAQIQWEFQAVLIHWAKIEPKADKRALRLAWDSICCTVSAMIGITIYNRGGLSLSICLWRATCDGVASCNPVSRSDWEDKPRVSQARAISDEGNIGFEMVSKQLLGFVHLVDH